MEEPSEEGIDKDKITKTKTKDAIFLIEWENKLKHLRFYRNNFIRHNYDSKT